MYNTTKHTSRRQYPPEVDTKTNLPKMFLRSTAMVINVDP